MKTVVITGGSRGLGFALANEVLKLGSNVSLLARDEKELNEAKDRLGEKFETAKIKIVVCDVTHEDHLSRAINETFEEFGPIDTLINNAGAILVGPFESTVLKDFEAQMNLHLYAAINSTRMIAQHFRNHHLKGRIINICSMGGKVAVPHMLPYDTSKFALAGFSQGVASELAQDGITVTTIYPALMRTGSPIQAVFKGDHEKEFAWFASGDSMPGFSLSAEVAARKIIKASLDRKSELVPSFPGQVRLAMGVFFPETTATLMAFAARLLPKGQSFEYKTGAQSRKIFDSTPIIHFLKKISDNSEKRYNQKPKTNARFNLGLGGE